MTAASGRRPVAVVGGGPAGSVAALCLRKLGHPVELFERAAFPRYRIGESLLPGTLSILHRLGLADDVARAGFVKKNGATFVWGEGLEPWTFTFATPRPDPWVYDHGYQVDRASFDDLLLRAAERRGAVIHREHEVDDIEPSGDTVRVGWRNGSGSGTLEADFVVDATGSRGLMASKLGLRRHDDYFRNVAVWSYFENCAPFPGSLAGNSLSVAFARGWIWLIPLAGGRLSVGVVTDRSSQARIRDLGLEAFYRECLEACRTARERLAGARPRGEVRTVRDWAYDCTRTAADRVFICGDAACFIDPLFSQGVHLAAYSAMLASAAIDRQRRHGESSGVYDWFDATYRRAYDNYHRFLCAFYAHNQPLGGDFWGARGLAGAADAGLDRQAWYAALTGGESSGAGLADLAARTRTLAELWRHGGTSLNDAVDETELSHRRVLWASDRMRRLRKMTRLEWTGAEVRLVESFAIDPTGLALCPVHHLGDERGRAMTAHAVTAAHRELFAGLRAEPLGYVELGRRLKAIQREEGTIGAPHQIVGRLIDAGLLRGLDGQGTRVALPSALRFGGVGAEDELS